MRLGAWQVEPGGALLRRHRRVHLGQRVEHLRAGGQVRGRDEEDVLRRGQAGTGAQLGAGLHVEVAGAAVERGRLREQARALRLLRLLAEGIGARRRARRPRDAGCRLGRGDDRRGVCRTRSQRRPRGRRIWRGPEAEGAGRRTRDVQHQQRGQHCRAGEPRPARGRPSQTLGVCMHHLPLWSLRREVRGPPGVSRAGCVSQGTCGLHSCLGRAARSLEPRREPCLGRLTAAAGLIYHPLRLEMPARASREAGEIPAWTRRCDRGRRPHEATVSSLTGRRGRRVIRKPEDLSPSALTTLCVVNGAAAARAAASKTGGPGPTKCRPGLCRFRDRKAASCSQASCKRSSCARWAATSSSRCRCPNPGRAKR